MARLNPKANPNLSQTVVEALQPREREYVQWCGSLKGFGCRVYPLNPKSNTCRKTFIAQYDFYGRTRKVKLGVYGAMTVETARKEAKLVLADAQRGIDVAEAKAKKRGEMTVAELCDEYLLKGCKEKKPSTLATDRGRIERHIKPLLGTKKIGDVKRGDVERFKNGVAEGKTAIDVKTIKHGRARVTGGNGAATRTVRLLGGIFTYAIEHGYIATNPRHGVKVHPDGKGERFLSNSEYQRLGDALLEAETIGLPWQVKDGPHAKHTPKKGGEQREVVSPYAIAAIRLLLLTGARCGEILNLKWSNVDFENGFLHIADSKTGKKSVLVGAAAMKVLADLPRIEGNPYVIVGEAKGKPRTDLKRPWNRITAHAGLTGLRLHDIRHSYASAGAASGMGLGIVGKLLGHASTATTARYSHYADDPLRRASDGLDSAIAASIGLAGTGEVVPFKRGVA